MKRNIIHFYFLVSTAFLFNSCQDFQEDVSISFYKNPNLGNYKLSTVALLPMINDDTTGTGTFYSTNYFYNRLLKNKAFTLIDIDKFISSDSTAISRQLNSLKSKKFLDLDDLFGSDLGSFLLTNNVDAIIIGDLKHYNRYYYTWLNQDYRLMITLVTKSDFEYYLASLHDGKVLWKADIESQASIMEILFITPHEFPPVDLAISNGIDVLLEELNKLFFK